VSEPPLSPEIVDLARLIRRLEEKPYVARDDRYAIRQAKLRIAHLACRSENLPMNRETLAFILGPDSEEILGAYDAYLERTQAVSSESGRQDRRRRDGHADGSFWKGV
jgi:hypothetical protein